MRAFANTALAVASLMVGILFCEVGLRMVGFPNPGDFKMPRTGYYPRFYFEADPVTGHDIARDFSGGIFLLPDYINAYGNPFRVSSNSLGCRDRQFDSRDGYVLLLGDSFTWGYVALEQNWGTTLEQFIGARVLKCGVSGYGARNEREKLNAVVTRAGRPAFVIVGHVMNDLFDDYFYPRRTVVHGFMLDKVVQADPIHGGRKVRSDEYLQTRLKNTLEPQMGIIGRTKDLLADYSILYDLLGKIEALRPVTSRLGFALPPDLRTDLEAFRSVAEFPWLEQAWEEHLESLRQLKFAVEALGATMLIAIFPDRRQVYDSLRPRKGNFNWEYPNQRLMEFFKREQIAFVDLLPEFRRYVSCIGRSRPDTKDDLYWSHDDHPNVKGNHLSGLLIARHVLERSFLPVEGKGERLSNVDQLLNAEDQCRTTTMSRHAEEIHHGGGVSSELN